MGWHLISLLQSNYLMLQNKWNTSLKLLTSPKFSEKYTTFWHFVSKYRGYLLLAGVPLKLFYVVYTRVQNLKHVPDFYY